MTAAIALLGETRAGLRTTGSAAAAETSTSVPASEGSPSRPDPDRAFRWVGNHIGLDLCNTAWEEDGAVIELLTSPRQLAAWFMYAGLHDCAEGLRRLDRRRARAATAWVRDFRDALRDFVAADGVADTAALNDVLAGAEGHLCVRVTAERRCPALAASDAAQAVRIRVATAALDVLTVDPARVRVCCGPRCTFLFVDVSRSLRRRWCDVDRCIDRQ